MKSKWSIKDKVLFLVTISMTIVFFVCGAALDSNSIIPFIGTIVSLAWLLLVIVANLWEG